MKFDRVTLRAAPHTLASMRGFYAHTLGLPVDGRTVTVGETAIEFVAGEGAPFYHFAALVPGDRFAAAHAWIGERTTLLAHRDSTTIDFPAWGAQACYFHDPAGNIVELIAHADAQRSGARGPFAASELIGLSELGLVGDPQAMAASLTGAGLSLWDGSVTGETPLGFVGEKARTLILARPGRGWMPTGRPAERHRADVVIPGVEELSLENGLYRLRRA